MQGSQPMPSTSHHPGWTQALKVFLAFLAWTLTSFFCHECGKLFLQRSELRFLSAKDDDSSGELIFLRFKLAFILTAVQCLSCLLLVRSPVASRSQSYSRGMLLLMTSHALATLATNYSMAHIEAASTQAIKLTEPITMAMAHHVIFQTAIPIRTLISIPLIICGALGFTGFSIKNTDSLGVALAFASNLILAARNITIKKLQSGSSVSSAIELKPARHVAMVVLAQLIIVIVLRVLELGNVLSGQWSLLAGFTIASGLFHVAYSYISTAVVLKRMDVVTHSIANIFKRILVTLMLYALGSRHMAVMNGLGLIMAACGLAVHGVIPGGHKADKDDKAGVPKHKMPTGCAILLVIVITAVGCLGFVRLQAKVERVNMIIIENENNIKKNQVLPNLHLEPRDLTQTETDPEMKEFLTWRLVDHPEDTDRRSKTLTDSKSVIEEAQRILINILKDLLGKAKHAMFIGVPIYENKGDPAIAVGQMLLLQRMNISIVFHCEQSACLLESKVNESRKINKNYGKDELVIFMQGGGNLVGYFYADEVRKIFLDAFPERRSILFSQSIWLHGDKAALLARNQKIYSNRTDLIMLIRDRQSLDIAKANFKGAKFILAPDLAFCFGMVPRQLPPLYDILWLKRTDNESSKYKIPRFPPNLSVLVDDWLKHNSSKGRTILDRSFLIAAAGFQFLQQGRIVVTDRLHGHILSTLMDIPHVLIDNPPFLKLSSFHQSWTQNINNSVIVHNGKEALIAALNLLQRYHKSLPPLVHRPMYIPPNKK